MNPILSAISSSKISSLAAKVQPVLNLMQTVKAASNPALMMQKVLNENPEVTQLIEESNGDARAAFYKQAKQMGIDPDMVISMIK